MVASARKTIALCVTGSIAAYKSVEVLRLAVKAGMRVLPVMTRSAGHFVGGTTLAGLAGEAVSVDMWDPGFSGEKHVAMSDEADLIAIVPATADVLARLADGRADDLVTALALCRRGPLLVAPAMHPRMWTHPATQTNVARLKERGRVSFVGPVDGLVASGESGIGRMAEPEAIFAAISGLLAPAPTDLAGARIVVTAGPTVEDLDPVRFLGNRSSGKMGFAVAAAAARRGAVVTLITGPVTLRTPEGVRRVDVRSALEMQAELRGALAPDSTGADAVVMTAAVADYRPKEKSPEKIKKQGTETTLTLVRNPDLLAELGRTRGASRAPYLVGFAVETGDQATLVRYARSKLVDKKCDLVVANAAQIAFGGETNQATFVTASEAVELPVMTKDDLADRILDAVRDRA